jgi:hypothetical protein
VGVRWGLEWGTRYWGPRNAWDGGGSLQGARPCWHSLIGPGITPPPPQSPPPQGLYKRLRAPGLSNDERQALVWEMVRLLDAHVAAEEAVLCPALAKVGRE